MPTWITASLLIAISGVLIVAVPRRRRRKPIPRPPTANVRLTGMTRRAIVALRARGR